MATQTKRIPRWIRPVKNPTYTGIHIIGDLWGCKTIDSQEEIEGILIGAATAANNTILQTSVHKFEPQGVTGVIILAESHISIHTWPEIGYVAVDAFTCGADSRPHNAILYLRNAFRAQRADVKTIKRGRGIWKNEL